MRNVLNQTRKKVKQHIRACGQRWLQHFRDHHSQLSHSNSLLLPAFEMFVVSNRLATRDYLCTSIKSAAETAKLVIQLNKTKEDMKVITTNGTPETSYAQ